MTWHSLKKSWKQTNNSRKSFDTSQITQSQVLQFIWPNEALQGLIELPREGKRSKATW